MFKQTISAALLTAMASVVFAQAAPAPAADPAASAPKKHKYLHAPKLRKGASAAVDPEKAPDKKGGQ